MLNKNKNNDIHSLIMDQLTDVENTLVALEGFLAAATAECCYDARKYKDKC